MRAILIFLVIVSLISNAFSVEKVPVNSKTYYAFKAISISGGQSTSPLELRPVGTIAVDPVTKMSSLKCKNDSEFTWYIFSASDFTAPFKFEPNEERHLVWKTADSVMVAATEFDTSRKEDLKAAANIYRTGRFK
ncbi:hypothetical protein PGT21_011308 [Puccinia graminis f. sp. tritici]|uniref:Uncharacterized protein n=1 Tax=Puccinia graminis f. sp. tritici TaxID=56615 RepID=A0A5B0LQG0_PUCGR|nr:hypothetical protein PGTUg99_027688 [Puccinia graminis f. sp. tritici]KAA1071550.1 hypothetical protein PGT21_011308 [Puccinia graminis f. sp. tritici]